MIAVLTHAYPSSSSRLTLSLWVCVNELGQGQLCTDTQMWWSAKKSDSLRHNICKHTGGDPESRGRRDSIIYFSICVYERSTSAKPIAWVQTRSILSTRPSPLLAANQHWPTKSQARPFTCPLFTCIKNRQQKHLDSQMESPSTEGTAHSWTPYLRYLHLFEVPVRGGSRVVMPDMNPPHWAEAVGCTVASQNTLRLESMNEKTKLDHVLKLL